MKKHVFGGRFFYNFHFFRKWPEITNITHGSNDGGTHSPQNLEFRQFFMTNWSKKGINSATEKQGSKKNPRKNYGLNKKSWVKMTPPLGLYGF